MKRNSSIHNQLVFLILFAILSGISKPAKAGPTTTIITHGFTVGSLKPWIYNMADAIIAEADEGSTYEYDPDTGEWLYVSGDHTNNIIVLIFNWAAESDAINQYLPNWKYSPAAGDALYAALRYPLGTQLSGIELLSGRDVHFIGHSRGTCVNSEAVRRLAAANIDVDQVTTLDPHPCDGSFWIEPPNPNWGDPTPEKWDNVSWADNYWRDDLDPFDFNGIALNATRIQNFELDEDALEGCTSEIPPCLYSECAYQLAFIGYSSEHSDTHLWYHGTIDKSQYADDGDICLSDEMRLNWYVDLGWDEGYCFSAIANDTDCVRTSLDPGLDPGDFGGLDDDIPVIFNGDFDQGSYAGWRYHGGTGDGSIVPIYGGVMRLSESCYSMSHNRFYLPSNVATLKFKYKVTNASEDDRLLFRLFDAEGTGSYPMSSFALTETTSGFVEVEVAAFPTAPRNRAYRLNFINAGYGNVDSEVLIDDVEFTTGDVPTSINVTIEELEPNPAVAGETVVVSGTVQYNTGVSIGAGEINISVGGNNWTDSIDQDGTFWTEITAPSSTSTLTVSYTDGDLEGSDSETLYISSGGSGYTWVRSTTCKDVDSETGFPINETPAFGHDDWRIHAWCHLADITTTIRVKTEFFTPSGYYYGGWTTDPIYPPEPLWTVWTWWDIDNGCPGAWDSCIDPSLDGEWTVRTYVHSNGNWNLQAVDTFVLVYEINDHTMCEDMQDSSPYMPINPTNTFYQTDERAFVWFEFGMMSNAMHWKREWTGPDGSVWASGESTTQDPEVVCNGYCTTYRTGAGLLITGYGAEDRCGSWSVDVFVEDVDGHWEHNFTETFEILESPPVDPTVTVTPSPSEPNEGDAITLNVSASDNTYLDSVTLYWSDGTWHEVVLGDEIIEGTFNDSLNIGSFSAGDSIHYYAVAVDTSGYTTTTEVESIFIRGWIGDPGGSWFDPGNWSGGEIPHHGTSVIVPTTIIIDQNGAMAGMITVTHGGHLVFSSGSIDTYSFLIEEGGIVSGDGSIWGPVFNFGVIKPGNPIGILEIWDSYWQTETGVLEIEIQDINTHDGLGITQDAFFDGTLRIVFREPYEPEIGQIFNIIEYWEGFTGYFSNVDSPYIFNCLRAHVNMLPNNVQLIIVPGNLTGQIGKVVASDGDQYDQFGHSVSIDNNRLIIGTYNYEYGPGKAYVYNYTGSQWLEVWRLSPDYPEWGDYFGHSVSIWDNKAVIGAYGDDEWGYDAGAAYLFDVMTGEQLYKLTAEDATDWAEFGSSVSINEEIVIIGANGQWGSGGLGSAYIFDANTGEQRYKLIAEDEMGGDAFGWSVSVSGNIAVIGAPGDDDAGNNCGSAYLFDVTTGTQLNKLTANDTVEGDRFGCSVSIDKLVAVIGVSSSNSAYVFNAVTGEQLCKLTAVGNADGEQYGSSVSINDHIAIIGGNWSNSAYVFDITTCEQIDKLTADDASGGEWFGYSVSHRGNIAVIGAIRDDVHGFLSGSAYLFAVPSPDCNSNGIPDECDISSGTSNDINGNGIPDECEPPPCPADLTGDGFVNIDDIFAALGLWGTCPNPCPPSCTGDLTEDCTVNIDDIFFILGQWGACP